MLSACPPAQIEPMQQHHQHNVGSSVPAVSRQGRENQRFAADGARLVAGCIPVRYTPGEARPDAVRVLLISSSNGSGWVFPKGGWELDESVIEAARRETVEEGGVRGDLEEPQLGVYPYSNRKPGSQRKGCIAHVFVMNVQEELTVWPEAAHRTRRWVTIEEASRECRHPWMRSALHDWVRQRGWAALADRLDADAPAA